VGPPSFTGVSPSQRGADGEGERARPRAAFSPPPMRTPQPRSAPPPAKPQQGGGGGGLLGTMMSGMAFGTGSAIMHEAVHAGAKALGGGGGGAAPEQQMHSQQGAPEGSDPCGNQQKAFLDCMQARGGDMGQCQFYFDSMQQCKLGISGGMQ